MNEDDRVLIRNVGFKGPHKLADKWKDTVYCVVSRPNDGIPVYRGVRPETGKGVLKVLHRNMIRPIGVLTGESQPPPAVETPKRPVTRQIKHQQMNLLNQATPDNETVTEDQDDDDNIITIWPEYEKDVPVSITNVEVPDDISNCSESCDEVIQRSTESPHHCHHSLED